MLISLLGDVPKTATQLPKNDLTDSHKKMFVYANIHYERNIIAPWPLCKREKRAADSERQQHVNNVNNAITNTDTIVISDSDDDCDDARKPPGNAIFLFVHSLPYIFYLFVDLIGGRNSVIQSTFSGTTNVSYE